MTHFNFLSFPLVTHISPPPSIQTISYYTPFESYSYSLSNEGVPIIRHYGWKVLYSEYSDFSYLLLYSGYQVFIAGGQSHLVDHILLAMLTF